MIAVIIDCFVCWAVRDLDLYSEDPEEDKNGRLVNEDSSAMKELKPMIRTKPGTLTYEDSLLRKLET